MKLIVDENIPLADAFLGALGEVEYKPGRLMTCEDVRDADALFVRSVTQVNSTLLEGSSVTFVGSATIGEDHLDTEYLKSANINYTTAPGCNATAVVEYVAAALLEIEAQRGKSLQGKVMGIVGLGNVGSRLKRAFEAWGMEVIACDPPLADNGVEGLLDLKDIFQADILSIHTPLTREGKYPTYHMFNSDTLSQLKQNAIVINASRGAVVDNQALKQLLQERGDLSVVLDVWEGEPFIDAELAQRVDIATPHIAGYSYDGKVKGTAMIYQAFCRHLGINPSQTLDNLIPSEAEHVIDLNEGEPVNSCRDLVRKVYRIQEDDMNLRASLMHPKEHRIAAFDQLRKHYRLRREFNQVQLRGVEGFVDRVPPQELKKIKALGFELPSA